MKVLIRLVLLSFYSLSAQAGEKFEFYNGVRQLSMGGAGIAVVNDETAVFTNPAALGKLRDPFMTVVDPELHFGSDTGSYTAGFDLNIIGIEAMLEKIAEHPSRHLHLKAQLFPSIVVPNFGAGVLVKYEANGDFDSVNDEIDFDYTNDFTGVLAYNLRLFDGRVKLGFSGRYINRSQIKSEDGIPSSSTNVSAEDIAADGGAIAADAGLILTVPWSLLPTLAVVVRDIGNTSFTLGSGFATGNGDTPDTVEQSVDVAIALFPILANRTRTSFTVEMRDVLSEDADDEEDIYRRLHAGIEFNFNDIFFVRGGMNGRYWTAGGEFAIQNFQFQGATYGEEIGTATAKKQDRRYVMKFSYRF